MRDHRWLFHLACAILVSSGSVLHAQDVREGDGVYYHSKAMKARILALGTKGQKALDVLGYLGSKGFYLIVPEDVLTFAEINQERGYVQTYRLNLKGLKVTRLLVNGKKSVTLPYKSEIAVHQIELVITGLKKKNPAPAPERTRRQKKRARTVVDSLVGMRRAMGTLFWANPGLNGHQKKFENLESEINELKQYCDELSKAFEYVSGNLDKITDPALPFKTIGEKELYFYTAMFKGFSDIIKKAGECRKRLRELCPK